jgi:hypothetical protein
MAELASRWGVTPNTVSRRLAFLGIKPLRQGNYRFLDQDQIALANELHDHVLSGRPMETFPRPDQPDGQVVRRVASSSPPPSIDGDAALALIERTAVKLAAINSAKPSRPKPDPLAKAKLLVEAAELDWLNESEIAQVLGTTKGGLNTIDWPHAPRPGFSVERTEINGQAWFRVVRENNGLRALTSHTTRPVGFAGAIEASYRTISAHVELPMLR